MSDSNAVSNVKALFKNRKSDYTISAKQLAGAIERDGKTLRAYLRRAHTRSAEMHNASWQIDKDTALAAAEHFSNAKRVKSDES